MKAGRTSAGLWIVGVEKNTMHNYVQIKSKQLSLRDSVRLMFQCYLQCMHNKNSHCNNCLSIQGLFASLIPKR